MTYESSTEGGHLVFETRNTSGDLRTADLITGTDTSFLTKIWNHLKYLLNYSKKGRNYVFNECPWKTFVEPMSFSLHHITDSPDPVSILFMTSGLFLCRAQCTVHNQKQPLFSRKPFGHRQIRRLLGVLNQIPRKEA